MEEITKRRLETARRRATAQRNYRRARDRALTKLAQKYPDDYQLLLAEERERDYAEGKVWLDLDGSTNSPDDFIASHRNSSSQEKDTDRGNL